jgi:pectate lyase
MKTSHTFSYLAAISLSLCFGVRGICAEPIGWATATEGTRGGADGERIEATDAESLAAALKPDTAKIVYVRGTISLAGNLRVGSNTSLVGVGADAKLVGGGLHIRKVSNVIVQNLTITQAPDAIGIEESHHVWIDHCDFSDCKDGLVDVKRGSDFVTISWNHFHDHHKTSLLGHSDKADIRAIDTGHLRVTYHHNYFDGTQTRHPRVRFADGVHVFNNYYRGNEYGIASVMDAGVIVEGNYFEDVEHPTLTAYGDSPDPGRLVERQNLFLRSGKPETRGVVDDKALPYKYVLEEASGIANVVKNGAGVGRIAFSAPPSGEAKP